jgi:hypothetical protein
LYGLRTRLAWPSAVLDLHAGEVAADVDEDPVALALAVQARPPRAQRHRNALLAAEAEHLRDIPGVTRLHHGLREEAVGAGVGGVADQVQRPAADAIDPEERLQLGEEGQRRPRRDPIGGGAGVRVRRLGGDALDVWLQESHGETG